MLRTIPLTERPDEGWQLGERAMVEVAAGRFPTQEWIARTRQMLDTGECVGTLAADGSALLGIAVTTRVALPGRRVNLLYLIPEARSTFSYREFLGRVIEAAAEGGPVAFTTGDILGLEEAEQAEMMEPLGFRHFSRTMMEFPDGTGLPSAELLAGTSSRMLVLQDVAQLAALHRTAYAGRFDRYLFMEDPDPARDSERMMDRLFQGEYGPFLPEDSRVAERDGKVVGGSIFVMFEGHPLLADVMVDPAMRGQGVAAALITAGLASLRARGQPALRLSVTDGNGRAERLYRSLGFVRIHGGTGWYSTTCIPFPPEQE